MDLESCTLPPLEAHWLLHPKDPCWQRVQTGEDQDEKAEAEKEEVVVEEGEEEEVNRL